MLKAEERVIALPHADIALKVWGDASGTPVIALHGWLDNASSFDELAPYLPNIRLYAIDFMGHGLSSHLPTGQEYVLWDGVRDVFALAECLGLERFALLGHSMGGAVATLAAGTFPERITKLGLIEILGPIASDADQTADLFAQTIRGILSNNTRLKKYPNLDAMIKARANGLVKLSLQASEVLVKRNAKRVEDGYVWRTDKRLRLPSGMRLTEPQIASFLDKITAPVQLVLGEQGMFSLNALQPRIQRLKQINVQRIEGGHHMHLDGQADAVGKIFSTFFVN